MTGAKDPTCTFATLQDGNLKGKKAPDQLDSAFFSGAGGGSVQRAGDTEISPMMQAFLFACHYFSPVLPCVVVLSVAPS